MLKTFDVTVTVEVYARDHAEALALVNLAVKNQNTQLIECRKLERVELCEVQKVTAAK